MLSVIRDKNNHVIAGFLYDTLPFYAKNSSYKNSIHKLAKKYNIREMSLFNLEKFSSEMYSIGFISFVEYAILNFQFKEDSSNDFSIIKIFNNNIDSEYKIDIIKIWDEYIDSYYNKTDNLSFINIIKALLKKLKYIDEIRNKKLNNDYLYEN